jgi:hypothetical protein
MNDFKNPWEITDEMLANPWEMGGGRSVLDDDKKPLIGKFIISKSVQVGLWVYIWEAVQKVSYFKKVQKALSRNTDYDIYIVRRPCEYNGISYLTKEGNYLSKSGKVGLPLGVTSVNNKLNFKNKSEGYNSNKKEGQIQKSNELSKHIHKFYNFTEVESSFESKELIIIDITGILPLESYSKIIEKELKISKQNYIISIADTLIHELYAHAYNILTHTHKTESIEHKEYHGQETHASPTIADVEKFTGENQNLPAFKVLNELKTIVPTLLK